MEDSFRVPFGLSPYILTHITVAHNLSFSDTDHGLLPVFRRVAMSGGLRPQPRLPNCRNRYAKPFGQVLVISPCKQGIGGFFEIHVCTLVDRLSFVN